MICHLEFVLLDQFLLERQEMRLHERNDGTLDWRSLCQKTRCAGIVGSDELRIVPAENRGHRHLTRRTVDIDHRSLGDKLLLDVVELFLQPFAGVSLASKPAAPNRSAAKRQIQTRLFEVG